MTSVSLKKFGLGIEESLFPVADIWVANQEKVVFQEKAGRIPHVCHQAIHFLSHVFSCIGSQAAFLVKEYIWIQDSKETSIPLAKQTEKGKYPFPAHHGAADSLFQTSGLGTSYSASSFKEGSNWDAWLNPDRIEGGEQDYGKFFIDVLDDPEPFIAFLKETGATAHRFSLEWSVLEPIQGQYDLKAIAAYQGFIQKLKENGIEPYLTLHHFTLPQWFQDLGGFEKQQNVKLFVDHAMEMMNKFSEVTEWMSFNEPGIFGLQTYMRGKYPPGYNNALHLQGVVIRNLLLAHCMVYKQAKKNFPDKQIGITHQWLQFVPLEGNIIEKITCYFLSKIIHYAVYDFLKTGHFKFQLPFISNTQLIIPEAEWNQNNQFLDFIGVQSYGFPRLKIGFNGGERYPGSETTNLCLGNVGLTFGATAPRDGFVQSFGPPFMPDDLRVVLTEAEALGKDVAITETGCDALSQKFGEFEMRENNELQKEYFEKIFPIMAEFQLKAFFVWTWVRGHCEWDRGGNSLLGLVKPQDRKMPTDSNSWSLAAQYISSVFKRNVVSLDAA